MYICLCEPVTERDIKTAVQERGCRTVRDIAGELGCCRDCGRCVRAAKEVIEAARTEGKVLTLHRDPVLQGIAA
ncbi:(2Fe-2S)-binding protein [Methyloversatilis thermotolerans]|uniref:(2Fe-2S)-binding protein n=1 Tax=Methyloversatilis thermotolerans TaxID=1346290 RepID=UPI00035EE798|nr:(2Fe-2S)-binding protein [Methyloversatilis thermotolerans]